MSTIYRDDGTIAVHTCAARGCTVSIPGELFMCSRHWKLLPGSFRHTAIKAYRAGHDMRNAIQFVEQRVTTNKRPGLLFAGSYIERPPDP